MIDIPVKTDFKNSKMKLPVYAHHDDAGFDLQANLTGTEMLSPGQTKIIPTGLFMALPESHLDDWVWELQVRPRSGLAAKYGITVLNTPGTVDAGYRNEVGVILHNSGSENVFVEPGDRIAQGILSRAYKVSFNEVNELPESSRGKKGFGSTGVK